MDRSHPKIYSPEQLAEILETRRSCGKIVFTNGCFDLLHPGHATLLTQARTLGDVLVVAVNSDASVRVLVKGPSRPVNTLADRMFMLAHLEMVDYVTWFEAATPYDIIRQLQPDILVKGGDWPVEAIVGRDVVEARGGKAVSLPLVEGVSTTAIIDRIRNNKTPA
ncbi:MAG: D-glycero-beta-D-manno-heptose 1-phosphate adenylyltransferase [Desulfovibrio sp.]|nr:D-glycero-beta-D-manno-heptose 1-phosphate adenylyltransferase [Desulfovibrio sp.]MCA1985103.1 D-glycero-beta-D-manno-heptose 1-phosphate adenylyltransferase [Desulfovibrio sp.]